MSKKKIPQPTISAEAQPSSSEQTLAACYLEHAARETAWMAQCGIERNYHAAADAEVRRGVWLTAALIAQERKA